MVSRPTHVLVVDDEPIVYLGLEAVLRGVRDIHLAGFVRDGRSAIERVCTTRPHLVVIEIALPNENGAALIRAMKDSSRTTQVLVFSRESSQETVREAFAAGASGYARKDSDPTLLPTIIRMVARGQLYLCPAVAAMFVEEPAEPGATKTARLLSPQEIRVLQHVAQGHTSKEIASALGVSKRTIDAHRASIMKKLGIHTIAGLARYAVSVGVALPESLTHLRR